MFACRKEGLSLLRSSFACRKEEEGLAKVVLKEGWSLVKEGWSLVKMGWSLVKTWWSFVRVVFYYGFQAHVTYSRL